MPSVKFPKHEKAVKAANGEIGVHETPVGSNTGPRVREYQRATFLGGSGWPWCVAFVQWTWQQAGLVFPYHTAGAYDLLGWARKHGYAVDAKKAMPGDAVVFAIGSGHAGILQSPVLVGGSSPRVFSIDGNTSDQVALRSRPLSQVAGFVHVPENGVAVSPPKPPRVKVATSEAGSRYVKVGPLRIPAWLSRIRQP